MFDPAIPFFPVESRAKAQSAHKDVLAKQVRGTVSPCKYPKAHLQIMIATSHISSMSMARKFCCCKFFEI